MSLKDKVVIITGASSGIGAATAKLLAQKGAKLVIAARRLDRLEELKRQFPEADITTVQADVAKSDDVQRLVDQAVEKYGRVDVMYNNAGIMPINLLDQGAREEWNNMIDTNIKGVLNGINAVLPIMERQQSGHIIATDSIAGFETWPGFAVYSGTKYAIRGIMEGLRQEAAPYHIKTTVVYPGKIATNLDDSINNKQMAAGLIAQMKHPDEIPMDILKPEAIAKAVVFAIDTPANMAVNELVVRPVGQTD
ncbi:MAG: SDR family oxidoreductase [Limosilactobacillus sp.]